MRKTWYQHSGRLREPLKPAGEPRALQPGRSPRFTTPIPATVKISQRSFVGQAHQFPCRRAGFGSAPPREGGASNRALSGAHGMENPPRFFDASSRNIEQVVHPERISACRNLGFFLHSAVRSASCAAPCLSRSTYRSPSSASVARQSCRPRVCLAYRSPESFSADRLLAAPFRNRSNRAPPTGTLPSLTSHCNSRRTRSPRPAQQALCCRRHVGRRNRRRTAMDRNEPIRPEQRSCRTPCENPRRLLHRALLVR